MAFYKRPKWLPVRAAARHPHARKVSLDTLWIGLGFALAALLGVAGSQPATAGDDGIPRGYYGGDVYVHGHVDYPPRRVRQVYPIRRPGPLNVHVVTYGGAPVVWYNARPPYFGPCYYWRCSPYRRR